MAYGDAVASLVGEKIGRHKYSVFSPKSIEGSMAMFATCFLGLLACLPFFALFSLFSSLSFALASLCTAAVATVCEALSPKGFDNLAVPLFSAVAFLLLIGVA